MQLRKALFLCDDFAVVTELSKIDASKFSILTKLLRCSGVLDGARCMSLLHCNVGFMQIGMQFMDSTRHLLRGGLGC